MLIYQVFKSTFKHADINTKQAAASGKQENIVELTPEQTIDQSNHEYQVENIKAHTYSAIGGSGRIITGKESKGKAVLVESHPEEDHYGEYQYESGNAGSGLFRS